jgi:hypothetical protein
LLIEVGVKEVAVVGGVVVELEVGVEVMQGKEGSSSMACDRVFSIDSNASILVLSTSEEEEVYNHEPEYT